MTKKVVGLITIFIISLSAMGAWDSKLIGTEQWGGICLNYANNTIQNPGSNLGVTGSTCFTRCMTGVSPYFSTYDNWDVTPLIVVKLDEADVNKIVDQLPKKYGVVAQNTDLFINVQPHLILDKKNGLLNQGMLTAHTWVHASIPENGSINSNIKAYLLERQIGQDDFVEVSLSGSPSCNSHDGILSPNNRLHPDGLQAGVYDDSISKFYMSIVKVIDTNNDKVVHQPNSRTVITFHCILSIEDESELRRITGLKCGNCYNDGPITWLTDSHDLYLDYPGITWFLTLLHNLRLDNLDAYNFNVL